MKRPTLRSIASIISTAVIIAICSILLFSPWFLENKFIREIIQYRLSFLRNEKGTYLQILGAMAGSFLAISGALWVQRIINNDADEKKVRENALIIYYDILLGFKDIKKLYLCKFSEKYHRELKKDNIFNKLKEDVPSKLFFSNEWIKNVAIIADELSKKNKLYVEKIYSMYGDLQTLKEFLDKENDKSFDNQLNKIASQIFSKDIINVIRMFKNIERGYGKSLSGFLPEEDKVKFQKRFQRDLWVEMLNKKISCLNCISKDFSDKFDMSDEWLEILNYLKNLSTR